ncbi:MAG: CoA pyrophosphatase [Candidatus Eremiobacteraeota bacterium]|nr:CoA pyrophosphatase [Candidatus Eremiobacteraeota bacterium]
MPRSAAGPPAVARLRASLERIPAARLTDERARRAAVLVPIVGAGRPRILCLERSQEVTDHKGEICFPGGMIEPADSSSEAAALRECWEEVALAPSLVDVLGRLDDQRTGLSNFIITPVVGYIERLPPLQVQAREVARPILIDVQALLGGAQHVCASFGGGVRRSNHEYVCDGNRIWGVTARILATLFAMWPNRL